MSNVLILGGRAPVALDHVRRFAHQGWKTYVADSIPCRLSGWSRFVSGSFRLASPRFDPAGFIADLRRIIERQAIELVVPTCEEVFFLSRYRHMLPTSCRLAVDDFDKLRTLHSKWHFLPLASECGGNPPVSTTVQTIAEAREWSDSSPIVLKPEFSRFGTHVRIYPEGLPLSAPELAQHGRWVAQRHCSGTELCSYSVADKGKLLAHVVYQPRYRLQRSSSFYFDRCASPAIFKFVETFVAKFAFTGQISFDWIDSGDGTPSVIECNPRAISGVHLFALDDALPAALTGESTHCVMPSGARAGMIGPVMVSVGLGEAIWKRTLRQWWGDFKHADDVLVHGNDYLPLCGAVTDIGSYIRMSFQQKCTLREAATRDIEWDGEELIHP